MTLYELSARGPPGYDADGMENERALRRQRNGQTTRLPTMPNHCAHIWLYYRHAAFLALVRGGREDQYLMEIIHYGRLSQ